VKLENEGAPTVISAHAGANNEALVKFIVSEIFGRLGLESNERGACCALDHGYCVQSLIELKLLLHRHMAAPNAA
jgi:hypothetical protein